MSTQAQVTFDDDGEDEDIGADDDDSKTDVGHREEYSHVRMQNDVTRFQDLRSFCGGGYLRSATKHGCCTISTKSTDASRMYLAGAD